MKLVAYHHYVAGWLDSSIHDFLDLLAPNAANMKYALITCLDSNFNPAALHNVSPELKAIANKTSVLGTGLLLPTDLLLEVDSRQRVFFGFDEVFFFPTKRIKPKPTSVSLVGPARLDQARLNKLGRWMIDNACTMALGGGEGLNFVVQARGLVRYLIGHSIEQPQPFHGGLETADMRWPIEIRALKNTLASFDRDCIRRGLTHAPPSSFPPVRRRLAALQRPAANPRSAVRAPRRHSPSSQGLHLPVPGRRSLPGGNLRSKARRPARDSRHLLDDFDARSRHPHDRRAAVDLTAHRQVRHPARRPSHDPLPQPGDLLQPRRPRGDRSDGDLQSHRRAAHRSSALRLRRRAVAAAADVDAVPRDHSEHDEQRSLEIAGPPGRLPRRGV